MNKYEAMIIIKPGLSESERKTVLGQINETILKNNGQVLQADIWAEKRKFTFPIKKHQEGLYYLASFQLAPNLLAQLQEAYKINENILRVLITRV